MVGPHLHTRPSVAADPERDECEMAEAAHAQLGDGGPGGETAEHVDAEVDHARSFMPRSAIRLPCMPVPTRETPLRPRAPPAPRPSRRRPTDRGSSGPLPPPPTAPERPRLRPGPRRPDTPRRDAASLAACPVRSAALEREPRARQSP